MNDTTTTLEQLKTKLKQFVEERDWQQFHSPKNLSMAIASEAAELLELFMWVDNKESVARLQEKRQEVEDEVADVILAVLAMASRYDIDVAQAIERKIKKNAQKYPVELVKGKWKKYNEY
jgi:dCTP diphosphatase